MSQDQLFEPPILVGDLAPLTRIKHGKGFAVITSYLLPRDGNSSVLCRTDEGEDFVLDDETVVEVLDE